MVAQSFFRRLSNFATLKCGRGRNLEIENLQNNTGVTLTAGSVVAVDMLNTDSDGAIYQVAATTGSRDPRPHAVVLSSTPTGTTGRFLMRGDVDGLFSATAELMYPGADFPTVDMPTGTYLSIEISVPTVPAFRCAYPGDRIFGYSRAVVGAAAQTKRVYFDGFGMGYRIPTGTFTQADVDDFSDNSIAAGEVEEIKMVIPNAAGLGLGVLIGGVVAGATRVMVNGPATANANVHYGGARLSDVDTTDGSETFSIAFSIINTSAGAYTPVDGAYLWQLS